MATTTRSTALALAGVGLLVATLGASAVLAPSVGVDANDGRETLIGIQGGGPGWHKYGQVIRLNGTDAAWVEGSADSYFDVTKLENGNLVAGFMSGGYEACGPYEPPCAHTGYRIIDPGPQPEVVAEWGFPVRSMKNSEVHAAQPLPSGGFVLTDMDEERIIVVKDGEITWEWRASNLYDKPPDVTVTDWLHLNDVDVIGEGRFLVSIRNANQLVIVERGEGAVEIINQDTDDGNDAACKIEGQGAQRRQLADYDGDGDIRCGDPAVLDHQHNPQWLGDGAVLVADSDNDRVVELHRTEDGSWEPVWTLRNANGIPLDWPRDADRLPNGNVLITDTLNKRIVEVTGNGKTVWAIGTRYIPYEADRLPYGETGGHPVGAQGGTVEEPGGDVPVLSTLLVGIRSIYPGLPFWFGELQLLLSLVSLGLVVGGGVDRYRNE